MTDRPASAAVLAALYSLGLQAWAVASTAAGIGWTLGPDHGGFNDWPTFITFSSHAWFGCVLGLTLGIGPYARARQAYVAASTGAVLPPPEQNHPPKGDTAP